MSGLETRSVERESLLLQAEMQLANDPSTYRVTVRNLSPAGMMGESAVRVTPGTRLRVDLRNIGPVNGCVAWTQDDRFGVSFDDEIDPRLAKRPDQGAARTREGMLDTAPARRGPRAPDPQDFRKL